jgi:hypothetical protein
LLSSMNRLDQESSDGTIAATNRPIAPGFAL